MFGRPTSSVDWKAYPGFEEFSRTGGYSDQDIQDLRARAIAPTRAVYQNAQANLDRNRALQGGNSPNYAAATAKMARELSHSIGDANVNVNASLADQIRQGKLAGLSGMTGIDSSRVQENALNRQGDNQALAGMSSLYSATPGMSNMFGSHMFQGSNDQMQTQQLRQALANAIVNGTIGMSGIPGNYQSALGNISGTLGVVGQAMSLGMMPGSGVGAK